MKLAEMFLDELERESTATRRVLERVPEGRNDWKPHEKSMAMGYLAALVASMPGWLAMMINTDELDIASPQGAGFKPKDWSARSELLESFDRSLASARQALQNAADEHLLKPWKFLVGGRVAGNQPRHVAMRVSALNHMMHHRGQLTVYLRLCNSPVPSVYGPSADEPGF